MRLCDLPAFLSSVLLGNVADSDGEIERAAHALKEAGNLAGAPMAWRTLSGAPDQDHARRDRTRRYRPAKWNPTRICRRWSCSCPRSSRRVSRGASQAHSGEVIETGALVRHARQLALVNIEQ
jgi:hypothetical protein